VSYLTRFLDLRQFSSSFSTTIMWLLLFFGLLALLFLFSVFFPLPVWISQDRFLDQTSPTPPSVFLFTVAVQQIGVAVPTVNSRLTSLRALPESRYPDLNPPTSFSVEDFA